MPRRPCSGTAGIVFHVMNRAARRLTLFETGQDYRAFLFCLQSAKEKVPLRLFSYCLMPNHFHLVLSPNVDGQLSAFMKQLLGVHSLRWRAFRQNLGEGAVYQGRYRAFAVETDRHFFAVCRYVERNPLRAGLVDQAEQWPWSSLVQRRSTQPIVSLDEWPLACPDDWTNYVNGDSDREELTAIRKANVGGRPFGGKSWVLGLASSVAMHRTVRPRGRPGK